MLGRFSIFLILAFVALILSGCVGRTMNVLQGDFDVASAPAIRGAEYNMEPNSSKRRARLEVRDFRDKKTGLSDVWNNHSQDEYLPKVRADINYVYTLFPIAFDFEWLYKKERLYTSFGFGLDPMPYGKTSLGANGSVGEVGISLFVGFDVNQASYESENYYNGLIFIGPWDDPKDTVEWTDDRYFTFRVGAGAYASLFLGPIALTYAPSVTLPWFMKTYFGPAEYETSLWFPSFFSHYLGVTYTYHEKIQASAGVSIVNGMKLEDRLYIASTAVSYLF